MASSPQQDLVRGSKFEGYPDLCTRNIELGPARLLLAACWLEMGVQPRPYEIVYYYRSP